MSSFSWSGLTLSREVTFSRSTQLLFVSLITDSTPEKVSTVERPVSSVSWEENSGRQQNKKETKSLGLLQLSYAPLFERRSGSGGHLEDLGAILEVLAPMASTIWKALKKERDSSIRLQNFAGCPEVAIYDFGFRSTFNAGDVLLMQMRDWGYKATQDINRCKAVELINQALF